MSKIGLAILAVGLLAVSSESYAGAWMPYEGEVSDLAVTTTNMDGGKEQEGMPVCRYRRTVGWLDVDAGVCHTVGTGKRHKVRTEDFYLLVQSSPDSPEGAHTDPWMPFDTDLADAFLDGDIEMDLVTTTNHDRGKLQEGMPICRYKRTVGWLDVEAGVCHTVGNGKKHKVRSKDFYVLQHEEAVDNLGDHAASDSCMDRGTEKLAFPSDFTEDSDFLANYPNSTRFDRTQTNSVFDLIAAASYSGCSGLRLEGGLYTISRDVADTSIVPPGFHLRGSTRGNQVPNTEIQGVATDGDMGSSRIRIEGAPIDQPSTISRLLLNNVNIEIFGAEDTRLANVAVTRVVLFNTNLEGPQVRLNHVEDFEVTESIFLRGADYGGKGLQTDNSTRGRISDNCFGGGINGAGSVVASGTNAGCPGEYFGARSVEGLASDQGHFFTAWNASEGLTESNFENNWVEGNTNTTVNVAYRGTTPKVDHGIYIKFADDITIRENHFEGWPFEGEFAARGHLKVRNASKISILSNDIVGMHVDLRPSITPATTGWDIPGGWAHGNVLRQSCTMIADNLFEGGEVSYNGVRKDGAPGQITAQVMVTRNQFMPHSVYSAGQGFRIRRGQRQLAMHTNDSFWIVRDDNTDGNGPVSFDITRWNRDGAGEVVASGTDRWGDECGW